MFEEVFTRYDETGTVVMDRRVRRAVRSPTPLPKTVTELRELLPPPEPGMVRNVVAVEVADIDPNVLLYEYTDTRPYVTFGGDVPVVVG